MRFLSGGFRISLLAAVLGVLLALPAAAAHNGNNKGDFDGSPATGSATINYSEGQGTFNGSLNVKGLQDGDYTFAVSLNGANRTELCDFTAGNGRQGCSFNGRELPGFNLAEILDADGNVVDSAVLARRGNCRDPQQGGSQCEANDTRNNLP